MRTYTKPGLHTGITRGALTAQTVLDIENRAMVVNISPWHHVAVAAKATAATVMPSRYVNCITRRYKLLYSTGFRYASHRWPCIHGAVATCDSARQCMGSRTATDAPDIPILRDDAALPKVSLNQVWGEEAQHK